MDILPIELKLKVNSDLVLKESYNLFLINKEFYNELYFYIVDEKLRKFKLKICFDLYKERLQLYIVINYLQEVIRDVLE